MYIDCFKNVQISFIFRRKKNTKLTSEEHTTPISSLESMRTLRCAGLPLVNFSGSLLLFPIPLRAHASANALFHQYITCTWEDIRFLYVIIFSTISLPHSSVFRLHLQINASAKSSYTDGRLGVYLAFFLLLVHSMEEMGDFVVFSLQKWKFKTELNCHQRFVKISEPFSGRTCGLTPWPLYLRTSLQAQC